MADVVFLNGWAEGPEIWKGIAGRLSGHSTDSLDPGYRGRLEMDLRTIPSGSVLVGHSLGALQLMGRGLENFPALVVVNGFTRFTACADFAGGVPARLVERMIARSGSDAGAVARDFLTRCGAYPDSDADWNRERLLEGLRQLRDLDGRSNFRSYAGPVLVLAAEDDPIVPTEMTKACFLDQEIQWTEGGHLLPETQAAWCAGHLQSFLDSL